MAQIYRFLEPAFQHQQLACVDLGVMAFHRVWGVARYSALSLSARSITHTAPADQVAHLWVRACTHSPDLHWNRRGTVSRAQQPRLAPGCRSRASFSLLLPAYTVLHWNRNPALPLVGYRRAD